MKAREQEEQSEDYQKNLTQMRADDEYEKHMGFRRTEALKRKEENEREWAERLQKDRRNQEQKLAVRIDVFLTKGEGFDCLPKLWTVRSRLYLSRLSHL